MCVRERGYILKGFWGSRAVPHMLLVMQDPQAEVAGGARDEGKEKADWARGCRKRFPREIYRGKGSFLECD